MAWKRSGVRFPIAPRQPFGRWAASGLHDECFAFVRPGLAELATTMAADLSRPDLLIALPDGRRVAVDDRGDPDGVPVLYLHGTPDSRLARHPDDGVAASLGVRLIAPDRPGIGDSDADPAATPASVADDLVHLLDALGIDHVGVLAWSAGSIFALALAGAHRDRISNLVLAAPLIPVDAYGHPGVLDGADESRQLFADALGDHPPDEIAAELAPWLVPPEIDEPTARAMLAASLEALTDVPGAGRRLLDALQASVAHGMTGIEREIAAQATPLAGLLDAVRCPVRIHTGTADTVAPPAMGAWLARRLDAELAVHDAEGHALAILRWEELLRAAADPAGSATPDQAVASAPSSRESSQSTTGTSDQRRSSS